MWNDNKDLGTFPTEPMNVDWLNTVLFVVQIPKLMGQSSGFLTAGSTDRY